MVTRFHGPHSSTASCWAFHFHSFVPLTAMLGALTEKSGRKRNLTFKSGCGDFISTDASSPLPDGTTRRFTGPQHVGTRLAEKPCAYHSRGTARASQSSCLSHGSHASSISATAVPLP